MARKDRTSLRANPRYQKKLGQRLKRQQRTELNGVINGDTPIDPVILNIGTLSSVLGTNNDNDVALSGAVSAGGTLSGSKSPLSLWKTYSGSGTTGSVTITASGGTSPYTYAWTLYSGDSLTVDSPTSNITTFSYTGSGDKSSIYKCTITDDVAATFDVFVAVDFIDISS